jgi:alpha-galactosidase
MSHTIIAHVGSSREGAPRLHHPSVYGASPGKPFLYRIPVTGQRPITFECTPGLPDGLTLDETGGIITGISPPSGEYSLTICATNGLGAEKKALVLRIAEDGLCRTPLLGFTTWNAFRGSVTQEDVRKTAELMISTGLADHGYQYVNIDSGWQGAYGGPYDAIQSNEKFPDMKSLADYVHELGLKLGIYSTPMLKAWGGSTFPGCTVGPLDKAYSDAYYGIGSDHRENNNVQQWADWGIDYLKYDWKPCDIVNSSLMKNCLLQSNRDFAFCVTVSAKKSDAEFWKTHCSSWRDNCDSDDIWEDTIHGVKSRFLTDEWAIHCNPGHYFDLDMLETGFFDGSPCRLTEDEQLVSFSIRALFPSPLQISCDISKLTDFDLSMLCNDEILAVNQDALGIGAICISEQAARNLRRETVAETKIYARPLEDGTLVAGFFNLGDSEAVMTLDLSEGASVRDLWAHEELGIQNRLALTLAPHSVRMVKIRGRIACMK